MRFRVTKDHEVQGHYRSRGSGSLKIMRIEVTVNCGSQGNNLSVMKLHSESIKRLSIFGHKFNVDWSTT